MDCNSIFSSWSLLDNLLEGFQVISREYKYLYVNKTICAQGRKSKNELIGNFMVDVFPGIEKTKMFKILEDCMENKTPKHFENEFTFSDNSKRWFELRFQPIPEGVGILSVDISERKLAEKKIQWLTENDIATNLPNRNSLIRALEKNRGSSGSTASFSLAVISLENAPELESYYGPFVTDEILIQLSKRVQSCKESENFVYRTKSNQICILLFDLKPQKVKELLSNLTREFSNPFAYQSIYVHGDIRIGYTFCQQLLEAPEHYLRKTEVALRSANISSKYWSFFTPDLEDESSKKTLSLLGELKEAMINGQLQLHYQPKVCLKTGVIRGVEALMRWFHPRFGYISPTNFIPRAEQSTLIDLLTEWAVEKVILQKRKWKEMNIDVLVAVNLSAQNLVHPSFTRNILCLLEKYGIEGEDLELEITEGNIILDIEKTVSSLKKLAESKITISIDDFGTGFSSLQYLNKLPVSVLKVDQSFVKNIRNDISNQHIVESIITLAHNLEMDVVAEGVEDLLTYKLLKKLGCDYAQGYYLQKPIADVDFQDWYISNNGLFKIL